MAWFNEAIFYHIYPLGFCGAPPNNDFTVQPAPRLDKILGWLDHIQSLGCSALYLGPVFESTAHGYDTADYYNLDRRLGTNATLAWLSSKLHERGMRLVLDGVFNHVGRRFWAFRDVQANGQGSPYCSWFAGLRFDGRSPYGDPFTYEGWAGNYDLVKLNPANPDVRRHLFGAVQAWVEQFQIDGVRLDTADCLDFGFMTELAAFCRNLKPDFWLMGEVIHGDYKRWANPAMLDAVTNYEVYKGLYSSHNDANFFEIAYAFNRQFGPDGMYRGLPLYNFADNHDVNRVASSLKNPAHLFTLYTLLLTMPGAPSIYYGSEWGIAGKRTPYSDRELRPCLDLDSLQHKPPQPGLAEHIARLARLRRESPALMHGDYLPLHVAGRQLAYLRRAGAENVATTVNAADRAERLSLRLPFTPSSTPVDVLGEGQPAHVEGNMLILDLPAYGSRVVKLPG